MELLKNKERRCSLSTRLLIVAVLVLLPCAELAGESGKLTRIKAAVIKSLCYDVYWAGGFGHGQDYRLGAPLPIKLLIEGDRFYARVDPIGYFGKHKQPVRVTRIGIDRGEHAIVITNYEPKMDDKFLASSLIEDTITIPTDCTPHYDPPTPQKERMLETIVRTMQKRLSSFSQRGIAKYPREVTLIIADFNVDYPSTYVLVEPPDEYISTVTLHNVQNYDSDEYEREGEYPFGEIRVQSHHKPLLEKIRKHGIIRRIVLDQN